MERVIKGGVGVIEKGAKPNVYRFVGSTEDQDRDGDVVRLDGWDTTNFEKNPVVFYGHDYRGNNVKFPVGTATVTKDAANRRLLFDITFTDAHQDAQTVKQLVDEGVLNTTSVGFFPKEGGVQLRVDAETNQVKGREFVAQELLEISIVPIPANPNAVRLALDKGLMTEAQAKGWGLVKEPAADEQLSALVKSVESLAARLAEAEEAIKRFNSEMQRLDAKTMDLVASGGDDTKDAELDESIYAELMDLGRKMADAAKPSQDDAKAREILALFPKQ